MTTRLVRGACAALVALVGCAGRVERPPVELAPALDRPAAAIPADLDVAIRLDLGRARRLLGPAIADALEIDLADPTSDGPTARFVRAAIGRSDTAWIGLRPGAGAPTTDVVIGLRGDFRGLDPPGAGSAWSGPDDLGAGVRAYRRPPVARRSAPTRIYARADDRLVLVSEAEVDAVERSVERHADDPHVEAPERGLLSVAARVPPLAALVRERFPRAAASIEEATDLSASADLDERGLRATIEAHFTDAAAAGSARGRLDALLVAVSLAAGPAGLLARAARASVVAEALVVTFDVDPGGVRALLALPAEAGTRP